MMSLSWTDKRAEPGIKNAILCVALTPAWQEIIELQFFKTGEVNRTDTVTTCAAGKGVNVARVLSLLDDNPVLVGIVGGLTGDLIAADLRRYHVEQRLTRTSVPSRTCRTIIERSTGKSTEIAEEAKLPKPADLQKFLAVYEQCVETAVFVAIAGAPMPGAPDDIYRSMVRLANARNVPVLIDARKVPLLKTLDLHPLVVKMNLHELQETFGAKFHTERDIIRKARKLLNLGAQNVMITDGERGAWMLTDKDVYQYTPPKVTVINAVGSGDAAAAGIVSALSKGATIREAGRLGIACGAANASTLKPGFVESIGVRRLLPKVKIRTAQAV